MTISEMTIKLDEIKVPKEAYSIMKGGLPNEKLCIAYDQGHWIVYYSERGRKSGLRTFENEDNACEYFFNKLKKYSIS